MDNDFDYPFDYLTLPVNYSISFPDSVGFTVTFGDSGTVTVSAGFVGQLKEAYIRFLEANNISYEESE